jgi:mRNA interferase MazF
LEKSLTTFKKGDVVVVDFPFSNLKESKRRPALIISNVRNETYIMCQITSKFSVDEYAVLISKEDFAFGNLELESFVRINVIFTVDNDLIFRKIGTLKREKTNKIVDEVISYLKKY